MLLVPDKTIAFIPSNVKDSINDISLILKPLNNSHERDWFTPHFYKCLPLSIGNMQGFVFSLPFDFTVTWNGSNDISGLQVEIHRDTIDNEINIDSILVTSHFGHGIFTCNIPFLLKTPPGINLMTIAPPNFPTPGISPMTGVVETDNLRFTFTLNFKVDLVNVPIRISKNYPIMGILPIPRYFCDSFDLVNGYDIFNKNEIKEEIDIVNEHAKLREKNNKKTTSGDKYSGDKLYYKGMDVRKNKFKDHQIPRKNK